MRSTRKTPSLRGCAGLSTGAQLLAALLLAATSHAAEPCATDNDCDDGLPCNGAETCDFHGRCRKGSSLCGNLSLLPDVAVSASSVFGFQWQPELAIDGLNLQESTWCTAPLDPEPTFDVIFPEDVQVGELRILTAWSPMFKFLTARFTIFDATDFELYESGVVSLTDGAIALTVEPPVPGARRVRFTGITWRSPEPCFSEFEVIGLGASCAQDSDCDDGRPCNGVEVCGNAGFCAATAAYCENFSPVGQATASSEYSVWRSADRAIDGTNSQASSWCTAVDDPTPWLRVDLPAARAIDELRVITSLSPSFDFVTGLFTILDGQASAIFESGSVLFTKGQIELEVQPQATGARSVLFEGTQWIGPDPCISELQVLGEVCQISLSAGNPDTIRFRPERPPSEFEIVYGLLSELRAQGGFDGADCLGRFLESPAPVRLAEPPAGDGYYFLARGLDVCVGQGLGYASSTPDPRRVLGRSACP